MPRDLRFVMNFEQIFSKKIAVVLKSFELSIHKLMIWNHGRRQGGKKTPHVPYGEMEPG